MTISQQHLARFWSQARKAWDAFLSGRGQSPELADAMRRFLMWKDLTAAAALRYRATRQYTRIPSLSKKPQDAINFLLDANYWAQEHVKKTQGVVKQVIDSVIKVEERRLQQQALTVEAGLRGVSVIDQVGTLDRQRRFARDRIMEVVNVSEQVQLADPYIGSKFPFSIYHSRQDRRVRPTHAAMDGLIASRGWEGWSWCRPPCGYGCRCTLRHLTRGESERAGYTDSAGRPRFDVRWPNPKAKANYMRGVPYHGNTDPHAVPPKERLRVFPDPGPWMEAKYTAPSQGLLEAA